MQPPTNSRITAATPLTWCNTMEIAVIKGDGIGPEVVDAAVDVLDATGVDLQFREVLMGQDAIDEYGTPLPDVTCSTVAECGVALKGPVKTPVGFGYRSVNVALRQQLDLYANIRPCTYLPGVSSRVDDPDSIDVVVVRENLEDVYAGIEYGPNADGIDRLRDLLRDTGHATPDETAYTIKPMSRAAAERIIRHAFEYAEEQDREKVTSVDKANIMKATDGLFMETAETIAAEYDVEHEHLLVDNVAQQLVLRPEEFDIVVTQNLYGDILSDLAAGLVGGVGLAPSANVGDDAAVFASVHGTAPDIAGEHVANPTALIRSATLLLEHIGHGQAADDVRTALHDVIADAGDDVLTPDMRGTGSTDSVARAVIDRL